MSNNNREDEAQKWYKEVEANRARAIADAIEAGTIVEVAKWDEPDLYKQMIATRLSKEPDMLKAFAMLDEVLSRQRGKYIFYLDGRVGQNTTDTQTLKDLISIGVRNELSNTADRARVEYYLSRWSEHRPEPKPTPIQKRAIPLELQTPEATKVFERAITRGLIENAPEGLKWCDSKLALSYFAFKASIELGIVKKYRPDGEPCSNYKPFEKCFGVDKLSIARANYMRIYTKFEPECKQDIDSLFE